MNTDRLVADAVADLAAAPSGTPAPAARDVPDAADLGGPSRRPRWRPLALAAIALAAAGWWLGRAPDPARDPSVRGSAVATTPNALATPEAAATPEVLTTPDALATRSSNRAAAPAPAPQLDTATAHSSSALTDGSSRETPTDADPAPQSAAEAADPAAETPARAPRPRASALLAEADAALREGRNRAAYNLAARSRRAQPTPRSLMVMATAGCRMGDRSKANSAFVQLALMDRRGIRAECRKNNVRLGI